MSVSRPNARASPAALSIHQRRLVHALLGITFRAKPRPDIEEVLQLLIGSKRFDNCPPLLFVRTRWLKPQGWNDPIESVSKFGEGIARLQTREGEADSTSGRDLEELRDTNREDRLGTDEPHGAKPVLLPQVR